MKQAKPFLIATLLTLLAFGAITYTSCTKNATCANSCLNGGICSNQTCICPNGFTGSDCGLPVSAAITYINDTYTPVSIIANGDTGTIPVGGSKTYTGLYGNPLNVFATTSGKIAGNVVGDIITWNLSKIFPVTGAASYGIDVDSTFFFLKVQNNSSYPALGIYVNYATPAQTYDSAVSILPDRKTHNVGYYRAFDSTEVYIKSDPSVITTAWYTFPFLPATTFTANQSYTYSFP